ncbi:MAG: hypothetical protein LQ341_004101 [Variospora aurantia]|nr:MAG: hypothetical protein LQ341_004101 [Variospora aurantia]
MSPPRFKLFFTVPRSSLEMCKQAVFSAGAGTYAAGKYSEVCFETPGSGQFLSGQGAKPAVGEVGKIERVEEVKVEVLCVGRDVMRAAVEKLKKSHPYEEPAYEVYAMEDV